MNGELNMTARVGKALSIKATDHIIIQMNIQQKKKK